LKRILVTGASGYVGGRLVQELLLKKFKVRVMVRDPRKISAQPWFSKVEVVVASAESPVELDVALKEIHTAYYLIHSINTGANFDITEARIAQNFAESAARQDVKQIIYLGGIANDENISKHLKSREQTGVALSSTHVPVMEMRAGIIIGSGSASFEMLRHLTHRLPIMTTPKWVSNLTQPIAIRDVLWYLVQAGSLKKPVRGIFDIGGPEVLTYEEMMQTFARIAGLPKRLIVKIPVLTPSLSSRWIGLVTPVPTSIARPLVNSLISEVVADPKKSIDAVIPKPDHGLIPLATAIELALSKISAHTVETRWSDASSLTAPWAKAQSDPEWAGEKTFEDRRELETDVSVSAVWAAIEKIGGEHGWYGSDFLWFLRGLLDRLLGGVGLRRGRRDPDHLHIGEALDFWRVEELIPQSRLRLYAEMILPGKAWLEFSVEERAGKTLVTQVATFSPKGLGGQLYWFAVAPFHTFIFPTMLRNIVREAQTLEKA
jgi:uncharacterized protein YbjT (DUF2867 family)